MMLRFNKALQWCDARTGRKAVIKAIQKRREQRRAAREATQSCRAPINEFAASQARIDRINRIGAIGYALVGVCVILAIGAERLFGI